MLSIIIDTDAAIDDFRAICMLLANPAISVRAITTCDGSLSPEQGLKKIRALLRAIGHFRIQSAAGLLILKKIPSWRAFNLLVPWGIETSEESSAGSPKELIQRTLQEATNPLTIVELGSFTNLAMALTDMPSLKQKIERIVWYNDELTPRIGTNYEFDPDSANTILESGIPIDVLCNRNDKESIFDETMINAIVGNPNAFGDLVVNAHRHPAVTNKVEANHLRLWDDFIPVFLDHPELFFMEPVDQYPHHRISRRYDIAAIRQQVIQMLQMPAHKTTAITNDVFMQPEFFAHDLAPFVADILASHGYEEWFLAILTHEIHRHLGIYSLIGVKMGLRARELLNADHDDLRIISSAGNIPPLSCMNDGLQISTGATLGHGAISVTQITVPEPQATFIYGQKELQIGLKMQIYKRIKQAIADGIKNCGGVNPDYFAYLRECAIRFWVELHRKEIFEETWTKW